MTDAATAISAAATAQGTADGKVVTFFQNNEPTTGSLGDLWIDTNDGNKLYRYSGSAWVLAQDQEIATAITAAATAQSTADSKIITFYQNNEPTTGSVGDLWIDTNDDNKLYRYSGTSWVLARDAGIAEALANAATAITNAATAQATADGKVVTFFQDNQPNTGSVGDLWIDTNDDNKLYRHNGTTWILAQDQGIVTAITAAADAQSTADSKVVTFYQDNEPTTGSVGDLWIDTNDGNTVHRYDGTNWVSVTSVGLSNLYPNQSELSIRSANYQQGVAGWAIDANGNAELNNAIIRGTLFAPDIDGDVYSSVTWDIRTQQSHTAFRNVPIEREYLTFTITSTPGLDRILVIPPIMCDTQTFRLYENNVLVAEVDTVDDPDGFDDITPQFYHQIPTSGVYGADIVYSLRTYDFIHPASPITSKAIRIPPQVVQIYYGKANVIVTQ